MAATNATSCEIQLQTGGTFQTSNYLGTANLLNSTNTAFNPTTYIPCTYTSYWSNSGQGISGKVWIDSPSQTSTYKNVIFAIGGSASTGTYQYVTGTGWYSGGTGAITGIQVLSSSGNITSGYIEIEAWN
jgi:hypothetical protein